MKIFLFGSFVIVSLSGCNPDLVPLKGTYPVNSIEITSNISSDSIWSTLIKIFADHDMTIKKEKGLIVTSKTNFIPVYSFEDEHGQLQETDAWVVLSKVKTNKKEWNPKTLYSKWSIRVSETDQGNIVRVDPIVMCTYYPNIFTSIEIWGQSTGKLEELVKISLSK